MRVTGTLGAVRIDSTGAIVQFTGATTNRIYADAGGSVSIVTNGAGLASGSSNVDFNADQSTTFNGEVDIYSKRVSTVTSGTAFPTTNLGLGDECYRTDLDVWYKYNSVTWTQI